MVAILAVVANPGLGHAHVSVLLGDNFDSFDPEYPVLTSANPAGVAITEDGDVLIADSGNHRVLRVSEDGQWIGVIAGTGQKGDALVPGDPASTQLSDPQGVAVIDGGDVVIADSYNHRVLRLSADGQRIGVIAGTGQKGDALVPGDPTSTELDGPGGVAVVAGGDIVIADTWNNRVLRLSADGQQIKEIAGRRSGMAPLSRADLVRNVRNALDSPCGVAVVAGGDIVIADWANHRVVRVSGDGQWIGVIAGTGREGNALVPGDPASTELSEPQGVAVVAGGDIVIADSGNDRVLLVSGDGQRIGVIAGTGEEGNALVPGDPTSTELSGPQGVAVVAGGDIVIADSGNDRVLLVRRAEGDISEIGRTVSEIDGLVAKVRNGLEARNVDFVREARERLLERWWMFSLLTTRRYETDATRNIGGTGLARFFRTCPFVNGLSPEIFARISDYVYKSKPGDFVICEFRMAARIMHRSLPSNPNTQTLKQTTETRERWCLTKAGVVRGRGLVDLATRYEGLAKEFRVLADSADPTETQLVYLNTKILKLYAEDPSPVRVSRRWVYGGAIAVGVLSWAVWNGWFGS